jgi:hypothetical protein
MSGYNGLPTDYVEQYVYQYVGYVKRKPNGRLNGGCPICHEGSSWQKESRFWYDPDREGKSNTTHCYNCGYNENSATFISDVTGLTFREVMKESEDYDIVPRELKDPYEQLSKSLKPQTLPENCINLSDKLQISYYKHHPIVKKALDYLESRLLLDACNRPKTFYISLDDFTHKNRLIIPYYDNGKIVWYQSRRLLDDDSPKYLSKAYSQKAIYNIDNVVGRCPYIFMHEGAIDSMFIENGSCTSGITEGGDFMLTKLQKTQLSRYPFHDIIWILDSPYLDDTANIKTKALVEKGEIVFKWPKKMGEIYKDINEFAVAHNIKKIPHEFIMKNLYKKDDSGSKITSVFENL